MGKAQIITTGGPGPPVEPATPANAAPGGSAAPLDGAPDLTQLLGPLSTALAQRYPFLTAQPPKTLNIAQDDAGLMAWAMMAGLFPDPALRPVLARWLGSGETGAIETAAGPLSPPQLPALEALMEQGVTALGEMVRSGSLGARLAQALVPEGDESLPALTGGGSAYQELSPLLHLFDAQLPLNGVLGSSAGSLPAEFGSGTTGGRATFGWLFDDALASDDFYRALPGTLAADFDVNEDGFTYSDDSFRASAEPFYADGARIGAGGFSGGALRVVLGGIDDNDIFGMSGGWERQIVLTEASQVSVTFRYQLTHSGEHENDEYAEVLMSLDGALHGSGANDYVARITGDGNGGPDLTTGWQSFTVDLGQLAAGAHSLVIGGYSNKKTFNDESTEVLIDDVAITESGGLVVGRAEGVLANDLALNGLPLSAALQSGPASGILSLDADGSFIYTPDSNFLGIDSFVYRVSDGLVSDSARVDIEVGNVIQGSDAAESLTGTTARDAILGHGGDDTLTGGEGDDRLTGGGGADSLTGGDGADIFAYDAGDGGAALALADTITDFVDGTDLVGLLGSLSGRTVTGGDLTVTDNGGDAVITVVASGEVLTVVTGAFGIIDDSDFVAL